MIQALEAGSSNEVVSCNEKVDIWAAGVVTYKLLFGQCPFCSESEKELKRLIVEGSLPGFMGFLSADCQDFLHLVGFYLSFLLFLPVLLLVLCLIILGIYFPTSQPSELNCSLSLVK